MSGNSSYTASQYAPSRPRTSGINYSTDPRFQAPASSSRTSGNGSAPASSSRTSGNGSTTTSRDTGNTSTHSTENSRNSQPDKYATGNSRPFVKPISSMSTPSTSVSNSLNIVADTSSIEENIQKLKTTIEKINTIWDEIKGKQINAINNSWAGTAAESYTAKVLTMEPKVTAAKEALQLMCDTYSHAIEEIKSKQEELKGIIDNI